MTLIKSISGIRGTIGGNVGESLTPIDVVRFTAAFVYWIMKRDKQYSIESLYAVLWIIRNFKKVWDKHLQVQHLRKVKDRDIQSLMMPYCGDPVKLLRLWLRK